MMKYLLARFSRCFGVFDDWVDGVEEEESLDDASARNFKTPLKACDDWLDIDGVIVG